MKPTPRLVVALVAVGLLSAAPTAWAAAPKTTFIQAGEACRRPATIRSGPNDGDLVVGTPGDDVIYAWGQRHKTIRALGGNDVICVETFTGGTTIDAGAGDDIVITADADPDIIHGGDGNDAIFSETGDDTIYGDGGDDALYGGQGNDQLFGGSGNDTLHGGYGRDTLDGGAGRDRCDGSADSDTAAACETTTSVP